MNKKIRITDMAPNRPSSSQMMAKIISFWGSGRKLSFWMLCPSPLPRRPPEPMA